MPLDLIIRDAMVIDGSGAPRFGGDVGIDGGKIVAVGKVDDAARETIDAHGAVSAEVARAMAAGALAHSPARFSVAVTGIAGPDGGTPAKPVGTVWIATAARGSAAEATLLQASGDRAAVRRATVVQAMRLLSEAV